MQHTTVLAGFWRALDTRRLLAILLFLGIFGRALRDANDADLWWHLATGQVILTQRQIPTADDFSYTAQGTRWYTHEWLTELSMYGMYQFAGKAGLILVAASIVTLAFLLVYLQCSARPHVAVFLVLAGAFASSVSWGVRPQILTMLGLAVYSLLLEWYRRGHRWPLLLYPVLTAVWVNLHAGYLLGPAFLVLNLVGDGMTLLFRREGPRTLTRPRWRSLVFSTLASLLSSLLNPNGWEMLRYPLDTLTSPTMRAYIQEWASPDFHNAGLWPFAVLLFGGAAALMLWRRQALELTEVLTFLGFALASLMSGRNVPLFAVVAPPIISRVIPWDSQRIRSANTRLSFALNWTLLVLGLAAVAWRYQYVITYDRSRESELYPQAALEYILAQGWTEQHIYNSYNWGGYLIWHGVRVFIDGRADVYGDAHMLNYLQTYHLTPNWRQPLEDYDVSYVLIEANAPLGTLLLEAPEWDKAYQDEVAVVFRRCDSE